MRVHDHVLQEERTLGLHWAGCSCGWRGRRPRLSTWGAATSHAKHVLAAAGGRLETLWLPEPNRYHVGWSIPLDDTRWRDDEVWLADPDTARWVADFLDNLPRRIRDVRLTDQGA